MSNTFENLNLNEKLLKGIYLYGYKNPSEIQINGIKAISASNDCILQSQSGTGKTATYLLATLNKLETNNKCRGIILAPTRELASQIYDVTISLSQFTDIKTILCIGGTSVYTDKNKLSSYNLIIGTLGRLWYLITSNIIDITNLKFFIIDEVDELVNNKNTKLFEIFKKFSTINIQIILISATLSREVFNLSKIYMKNPTKILLKKEDLILDLISQYYLDVENEDDKFDALLDLYNLVSASQAIIYCNTIKKLSWLQEKLVENNFTITVLNSSMTQHERNEVLVNFRNGITRILLTTDLLARGINIPLVNMVINYDLPVNKETYIHRIGRCGRFDKKGIAINIVNNKDSNEMRSLERLKAIYKTNINPIPDSFDIVL